MEQKINDDIIMGTAPRMADYKLLQSIVAQHVKVVLDLPIDEISDFFDDVIKTLEQKGKIIFFGNGGSAAQASHWAEEFVGRFVKSRKPLPAIALGTNFANITGIANDYGFEHVFLRELEVFGKKNDLVVGISTSGNSKNVIEALKFAKSQKIKSWILTGNTNSKAKKIADKSLSVNSNETARIQEVHALVIHMIFEMLEEKYS